MQQLTHNTGSFHKKEVYVMIFSHFQRHHRIYINYLNTNRFLTNKSTFECENIIT
jgi:hypothetical protein